MGVVTWLTGFAWEFHFFKSVLISNLAKSRSQGLKTIEGLQQFLIGETGSFSLFFFEIQ